MIIAARTIKSELTIGPHCPTANGGSLVGKGDPTKLSSLRRTLAVNNGMHSRSRTRASANDGSARKLRRHFQALHFALWT